MFHDICHWKKCHVFTATSESLSGHENWHRSHSPNYANATCDSSKGNRDYSSKVVVFTVTKTVEQSGKYI